MSIINQALQNVDSQGRPAVSAHALPGEVRFAEPVQRRSRPIFLIVVVVAAMFIGGGLFLAPAEVFSPFMSPRLAPQPVMLEGVGVPAPEQAVASAEAVLASEAAQPAGSAKQAKPITASVPTLKPDKAAQPDRSAVSLSMAYGLPDSAASSAPPIPAMPAKSREASKAAPEPGVRPLPRPRRGAAVAPATPATGPEPLAPQEVRLDAVQLNPAQKQAVEIRVANELMAARNYPEAEARLRAVLKLAPTLQVARLSLARMYALQFKRNEAKTVLREGLTTAPNDAALLLPLARLSADENEWQAAADVLAPAKNALAGNAEYMALNGAVLQGLGRFAESAEAYRAALNKAPQTGVWWVGYALSLEADGQAKAAVEAFRQALQLPLAQNVADFVQSKLARLPPT